MASDTIKFIKRMVENAEDALATASEVSGDYNFDGDVQEALYYVEKALAAVGGTKVSVWRSR